MLKLRWSIVKIDCSILSTCKACLQLTGTAQMM